MAIKAIEIKQALEKHKGMIAPAARSLGISRQHLHRRIKKNKSLLDHQQSIKEGLKDFAENILLKLIYEENFNAVKFYLSTQAKDRGYVERTETKELTPQKKQIFKIGEQIIEF